MNIIFMIKVAIMIVPAIAVASYFEKLYSGMWPFLGFFLGGLLGWLFIKLLYFMLNRYWK